MKRFVIVTKDDKTVTKIVECETTLQAQAECEKNNKGGLKAVWVKAESLEDVAERDPYVKIKLLLDQINELLAVEIAEEVKEFQPTKKWSNGRIKK